MHTLHIKMQLFKFLVRVYSLTFPAIDGVIYLETHFHVLHTEHRRHHALPCIHSVAFPAVCYAFL